MIRLALLPLLLLSACAVPGAGPVSRLGCTGEVRLTNAGPLAVEQAYFGTPADWGPDLLAPATLAPGAAAVLRAGAAPRSLRVVFVNGRAGELPGLDACATPEVTVTPAGLRATSRGAT